MKKSSFSPAFTLMAVIFTVCLITSNLFAAKVFAIGKVALPSMFRIQVRVTLFVTESAVVYAVGGKLVRPRKPEASSYVHLDNVALERGPDGAE